MRRSTPAACLLALLAACGEPPQKIPKPAASLPPGHPSPEARVPSNPARFGGTIALRGTLVQAREGSLFVIVRQKGSRMPALARKYEVADPVWTDRGDERVLRFSLDEANAEDRMGNTGTTLEGELELEARFDPDGVIETKEGNQSAVVRVERGDQDVTVTLGAPAAPPPSGG
jgi:hypothetical protein